MLYFIFWIVFSVVVGALGTDKSAGFWGGFIASLILSPLIGLIIVLASGPSKKIREERIRAEEILRKKIRKEIDE